MPLRSWSSGSCGKSTPRDWYTALYFSTSSCRSSAESSVSSATPLAVFMSSISFSKSSCGTPITTSPNISRKRRYESYAKRAPAFAASPFTTSSFSPRFSTVSIMPGIETAAPERTDRRRGLLGSPSFVPISCSTSFKPAMTSSHTPAGSVESFSWKAAQVSVVIVKPGGTERPMAHISARLAPLPPSSSFMEAFPWPLPFPKV
mmetsp:Transcript_31795/g.75506  ORF Transcript_31795/g.75506 Transcript_31795/m.75506 type:complete len:204 (+) Transcript_31795:2096-2707(+)